MSSQDQDQDIVMLPVEADNETSEDDQASHPWPHLVKYFVLKCWEGKSAIFSCVLCRPKDVVIKGHMSSLSNLKSHIRRKHYANFIPFIEKVKVGSARGKWRQRQTSHSSSLSASPTPKKAHQLSICEAFGITSSGRGVRQVIVDKIIVKFFVSNMLSFKIVDSESFSELVTTLNPSKMVMSRRTLSRRIIDSHKELEHHVIRLLENVPWVATTADCWSAHNKAYLGMTAHWVDPKTRNREHAVLAFSRLRGRHTFDVLAQALVDVHVKFNIQDKVTRTTTDNGSNFVKAFLEFGSESGVVPELPAGDSDDDSDDDGSNLEGQEVEVLVDEAEALQVVTVAETFAQSSTDGDNVYDLPKHMRCAAHTFNLVATTDAGKAIKHQSTLRSVYRRAMGKAQSLWNQQGRSTQAADIIQKELGRRLVVPNATRWNSTYDSVKLLNNFFDGGKRAALNKVMTQLKLQSFSEADVSFLKEYAQVMDYVAKALDVVQGEFFAYLGCLLPTLAITLRKLRETKNQGLQYCEPLVDVMLEGIESRFGHLFKDLDCQLAAAFHPMFRLTWMEQHDASQVSNVKKAMETAVAKAMREMCDDVSSISSASELEGSNGDCFKSMNVEFFKGSTHSQKHTSSHKSTKSKAQAMVKAWLDDVWKKGNWLTDRAFRNEQVMMNVFAKYNTAIPSSASVERLFSMGKDVLRAKRATLSDATLERLIFLKGNSQHAKDMEAVKD